MRTTVAALTIAGIVLAGAADAARAQAPGVDLKITPKVGAFAPLSDLREAEESGDFGASLEPSVAVGLAVDIGLPGMIDLRVGFDYATSSEFDLENGPTVEDFDGDAKVLAVAGDIVLRRSVLGVVSPYLLLGAGVKRYDFDAGDAELGTDFFDSEETDFTGHVGLGIRAGLGPLALVVEVSDYISSFSAGESDDSSLQNDIFGMVGIQLGIL